jgi:hypothetical protein
MENQAYFSMQHGYSGATSAKKNTLSLNGLYKTLAIATSLLMSQGRQEGG